MAVESCSEHEVATTREVGITSLPLELLGLILWSDQLTRDDVEAVRLSCHALAPAAASRLFYRISISNLVSDRDTFLAICNSPHLAQHVREVEWLEISHFFGEFDTRKENGVGSEMILEEDEGTQMADLCRYLETTSRHLFWLFSSPADLGLSGNAEHIAAVKASRGDAVARFCPVFESALDKLPSLHTFISRPMTSDRVIPDALYPIQASAFQSFKDTGSEDSVDLRRRTAPKWSWGRYFHRSGFNAKGKVYAFQVPDASPHGHATMRWRFTSRDGEVAYGDDPLVWFDDWDVEAGGVEEPLPYCQALRDFAVEHRDGKHLDLGEFWGEASEGLEHLRKLKPPKGAFAYDETEDFYSEEQAAVS